MGSEFIEIDGDQGRSKLYLNAAYITHFRYRSDENLTEVYISGVQKPFCFDGDMTEYIADKVAGTED